MSQAGAVAVVTVCSSARLSHLLRQQRMLHAMHPDVDRVVAWLDDGDPPALDGALVVAVPAGAHGLRVAAGRNRAAAAAIARGARTLVFLDADCLPGADLVPRYETAAALHPDAVLCGPVTYLAEGLKPDHAGDLPALTAPHRARPAPPPGIVEPASPADYRLFWSLSFAVGAETWRELGGFDEEFEGYGAEDTDLAYRARACGIPLAWVGSAHAYHQHHPTSSPPWQHLDDILRNGALFAGRWGEWPMTGWLAAFEQAGAISRTADGWRRSDVVAPV